MRFKTETIDGGLRFTSHDGWMDLAIGDGRAQMWCGIWNGTPTNVFGNRLWHLLKEVVPDLALRVIAFEGPRDPMTETILVEAGFTKEGTRRLWGDGGQDVVVYSILASEVVHEVQEPKNEVSDGGLLSAE